MAGGMCDAGESVGILCATCSGTGVVRGGPSSGEFIDELTALVIQERYKSTRS
jgi:hypothetical protein